MKPFPLETVLKVRAEKVKNLQCKVALSCEKKNHLVLEIERVKKEGIFQKQHQIYHAYLKHLESYLFKLEEEGIAHQEELLKALQEQKVIEKLKAKHYNFSSTNEKSFF